ncbi:MAG: LutB/LldF family L-lactate oxidation iron-sulfur protein [Hyphomicrobiales bacterium]
MEATSRKFKSNARSALNDEQLQRALTNVPSGFVNKRAKAAAALPEFEALRDKGREIKNHVLEHLDLYLEIYENRVLEAGGRVHWAGTAEDARRIIVDICQARNAKTITKGKSMISEEAGINDALEEAGITPIETDLGEYIVQLRGETPSHLIAPAVHLTKEQIEEDFRRIHDHLPEDRVLDEPASLVHEAREVLRTKYLAADIGLTGTNFLIAETGTSVIVTNEGNGDLTQCLPRCHIVLASIEKIVPTLEDASTLIRLLARSATGQEISTYTTFSTGPRRLGDLDGPNEYHVVLLDNGRSDMIGTEFQEMLRCIRCGACLNHCPVYQAVGGHSYGWVYSGPMGSVLTPSLIGVDEAGHLPNASTFCGRCEEVCPMRIPLPKMMRHWREREFERHLTGKSLRTGLSAWRWLISRPEIYHRVMGLSARFMRMMGGRKGYIKHLALARGWTKYRDLPAPQGRTFQAVWKERQKNG